MAKRIIKRGEDVFATGVFLRRDPSVNGGWVVMNFEDDTYFDGKIVNKNQIDENTVEYFTGDDDEEDSENNE